MSSKKHTHRIKTSETRGYTGGVSQRQEPRAAGGICVVDTCSCGAMRRTNRNQGYQERGAWTLVKAV